MRCIVASVSSRGRLEEKVAVVTGATSGFGEAIARLFAAERAALVLGGRRTDAGEALVAELAGTGADVRFLAGDVGEESTAESLAACAGKTFGRVDVAVLNAGIGRPGLGPFWEVEPADFDLVFRTNVRGVFLGARARAAHGPRRLDRRHGVHVELHRQRG